HGPPGGRRFRAVLRHPAGRAGVGCAASLFRWPARRPTPARGSAGRVAARGRLLPPAVRRVDPEVPRRAATLDRSERGLDACGKDLLARRAPRRDGSRATPGGGGGRAARGALARVPPGARGAAGPVGALPEGVRQGGRGGSTFARKRVAWILGVK